MNIKGVTSRMDPGKYFIWLLPVMIFIGCDLFKTNTPPVITSSPLTQVNETVEYEYFVTAEDADGDDISYSLTLKPDWLSIGGNRIYGTAPEVNYDKNYGVKVKASDGKDFNEQSFTIKVKNLPNNPPAITSEPITEVNENSYYEYYLEAEDEDGDNLAYSLVIKPSWIWITGRRIYGYSPEVENDSSVAIKARVTDGKDSDYQEYDLNIINVPAPAVSQTVSLSGDIDIEYRASLKDLSSAYREVFCNDVKVDSLSKEISGKSYVEILENNRKGEWKFVLSADGADSDEETIEVPNYTPTADISGLEGTLDFEQGEMIVIVLPALADKNFEDNPVEYAGFELLDEKTSARLKGDSLYVTNKKGAIGEYSIKLIFGNEENGEGETTIGGEISLPTIAWFNPFKRPVKGTYHYGSGDANQDGFIDSLDTEAISNGAQTDEADVNGDGIADYEDGQILEDYLNDGIPYMPGQYEKLQTKEERDDWVKKMMKIDPVSEMPYVMTYTVAERWVSGNYATQTCINFFGYDDEVPWTKYDLSNIEDLTCLFIGFLVHYTTRMVL